MIELLIGILYTTGWIWCFIEWRKEYLLSHREDKRVELAVFVLFMVLWLPLILLLLLAVIVETFVSMFKKLRHGNKSHRH
jgi:hypothetical protein